MTERELKKALNASLSQPGLTEWDKMRVIAQMKGEEPIVKRKISLAFALAMALMVILAATALAAGVEHLLKGEVNWRGEVLPGPQAVECTPRPSATVAPTDQKVTSVLNDPRALAAYETIEEGETMLMEARQGDSVERSGRSMHKTLASFDELADEGNLLPLPAAIPDGYVLTHLDATLAGRQYEMVSEETVFEGVTAQHWRPVDPFASAYNAEYENAAGETLTIRVALSEDSSRMSFGLWDDAQVRTVTVPGMDDALLFESEARVSLRMRRALAEPVDYQEPFALLSESDWPYKPYSEVMVTAQADALDAETLMALFAAP